MVASTIRHRLEATAHLTVRVPHGADGDMTAGALTVLRRLDALDGVEIEQVTGLTPGLNALEVDVEVTATLVVTEDADEHAARETLEDGTGIEAVHAVDVDVHATA
jgi:hypothetical protein